MQSDQRSLIESEDLTVHFPVEGSLLKGATGRVVRAVDGVSMSVYPNETLAVVGESGSGKSTLGMALVLLHRLTSGRLLIEGRETSKLSRRELKELRGDFQIVFQDPNSSIDPRMRIRDVIAEPLLASNKGSKGNLDSKVEEALGMVGLQPTSMNRLPHELSGGQKQRVSIARAIVTTPKFVVLDEPTSSLDVSVQAQILNLLKEIQKNYSLSYLLITHNIDVARYLSDRIAVMYAGMFVEVGDTRTIMENPKHPYTVGLIRSVPKLNQAKGTISGVSGDVPSPTSPPSGCRFHPRCWLAQEVCRAQAPPLTELSPGHFSACHFAEKVQL